MVLYSRAAEDLAKGGLVDDAFGKDLKADLIPIGWNRVLITQVLFNMRECPLN